MCECVSVCCVSMSVFVCFVCAFLCGCVCVYLWLTPLIHVYRRLGSKGNELAVGKREGRGSKCSY